MNNNSLPQKIKKYVKDTSPLAIGEGLVALAVIIGGLLLDVFGLYEFEYSIITGAILGAVISIINYIVLTVAVDKAINDFVRLRGNGEMDDDEADKFAKENSAQIQNVIKTSFILRNLTMVAALVIAFLTRLFNPLATAIPLLAFRPLLSVVDTVMKKQEKKPDPQKFVKYDFDEEDEKEKGE